MMRIDNPADDTWIIADDRRLCHYYAAMFPAGSKFQMVINVLGSEFQNGFYEMDHEVYSTFFWSHEPQEFASELVYRFAFGTRNPLFPIELVYECGGLVNGLPLRITKAKDTKEVQ